MEAKFSKSKSFAIFQALSTNNLLEGRSYSQNQSTFKKI